MFTSLQTYTNGANQFFFLSLSNSSLVLKTLLEEMRMSLEFTETEAVLNHTNIFLCGVPDDLANETGGISNFTGCAALSSRIILDPLPLDCVSSVQQTPCSYCLNEVRIIMHYMCLHSFPLNFRQLILHHSMGSAMQHLLQ